MNNRNLKIPLTVALRHRPSAYSVTVGALLTVTVVAAALEPPTAYLVPLAASAWAVWAWTVKRERAARYKRHG